MQVALHQLDLLLLFDDDALGKTPQNWIAAVDQFELGHVDRALMMRNHHRGEIAIGVAPWALRPSCRRPCVPWPASSALRTRIPENRNSYRHDGSVQVPGRQPMRTA